MPYNVITISRTIAAGGEDLGRELASLLGLRYVDHEVISRASELVGVTEQEMADSEAPRSLVERILDGLARMGTVDAMTMAAPPPIPPAPRYEAIIAAVIREVADEGNAVIVAHGAGMPLAGREDLLRVLVTASAETRAKRLTGEHRDLDSARKAVEESDRAREAYFRRFYGVDRELPSHYDVVVNTDHVTIEQAAAAVATLSASAPTPVTGQNSGDGQSPSR